MFYHIFIFCAIIFIAILIDIRQFFSWNVYFYWQINFDKIKFVESLISLNRKELPMNSEMITVISGEDCTEKVLSLVEGFASDLDKKSSLRLRLVAEEMINLMKSITGEVEARFWIDNNGKTYFLHISTSTIMYADKRKELVDIATKKQNDAARGVVGKLREVFELALLPKDERSARESRVGMMGLVDPSAYMASATETWSMKNYISSVNSMNDDSEFAQEAKNELERSIIANIAKEILISIKGDDVEMTVEWEA